MPPLFYLDRIARAWGLAPSQAAHEIAVHPVGMLDRMLEYRAYAEAYAVYDSTTDPRRLPKSELMDLVIQIDHEVVKESHNQNA